MKTRTGLILIAVAAGLVAGCGTTTPATPQPASPTDNGISALPASQIHDKALAAVAQATSVHIIAVFDKEDLKTNLLYSRDESIMTVTVHGGSAELRRIGNDLYIKPDATFPTTLLGASFGELATQGAGKWVHTVISNSDSRLLFALPMMTPAELLKPKGMITKGMAEDIDGVPTIELRDDGDDGLTMYVPTIGEPLPVRLVHNEGGTIIITYGEPVAVQAPPAGETIEAPPGS